MIINKDALAAALAATYSLPLHYHSLMIYVIVCADYVISEAAISRRSITGILQKITSSYELITTQIPLIDYRFLRIWRIMIRRLPL